MRLAQVVGIPLLLIGTGCGSYHLEPTPRPGTPGVRVRFDPPRPVDVAVDGADTLRFIDVRQLEGVVLAARGDTLTLAVSAVLTGEGPVPGLVRDRSTAIVVPGQARVTEVYRPDRLRSTLAVLGGVAIGALAIFVVTTLPD